MKILDFIIISYYIFLRKAKQNQLEASLFAATILPLLFSLISVLFWIFGFLLRIEVKAYVIGIIMLLLGFTINRLLLSTKKRKTG